MGESEGKERRERRREGERVGKMNRGRKGGAEEGLRKVQCGGREKAVRREGKEALCSHGYCTCRPATHTGLCSQTPSARSQGLEGSPQPVSPGGPAAACALAGTSSRASL